MGRLEPVYKWECNNGVWKITWEKQYFGWNHNSNDYKEKSWNGTFHVKAKEDFLGGNTISTNTSAAVTQEAHGPKNGNSIDWKLANGDQGNGTVITLPVPYVNVDELSLTQNSSEWTVYLGTEVDPLTELKNLYGKIDVNEVVTQTTDHQHVTMTAASDTLYEIAQSDVDGKPTKHGAVPETFTLSTVAPLDDTDWTTLINGGTVEKRYDHYGHTDVGWIVYTLTKEVEQGEPGLETKPHDTEVVGKGVEQYTFTVTYVPTAESEPAGGWHTTPGGSRGRETDNMESTNAHIIDVFAKKLAVKKMDATLTTALQGAEFALVKTTDGSTPTLGVASTYTYNIIDKLELVVEDDSGSVFISKHIPKPKGTERYFLIETQAPTGYVGLGVPVPVSLVINDYYRAVPRTSENYVGTQPDAPTPYDWREQATLSLDTQNASQIKLATEEWQQSNSDTPGQDSECTVLHYMVPNILGVILPATGGKGTGVLYGAGVGLILLAGTAGAALTLRKKKK